MTGGQARISEDGVTWSEFFSAASPNPVPALFLDRDGVVVEEEHYLHEVEKTRIIPGAGEAIAAVRRAGGVAVLVTNQSGIGRGYFGWDAFAAVQAKMQADLLAVDPMAQLDAVFACAFNPKSPGDHPWRKPNPGMLEAGIAGLNIDTGRSCMIGDKAIDLLAGKAAGCRRGFHVATGHGGSDEERQKALAVADAGFSVQGLDSIADLNISDIL